MFDAARPTRMLATICLLVVLGRDRFHSSRLIHILLLVVDIVALTNTLVVSTETKTARTKTNVFDPVLSANVYTGRLKENERTVQVEPRLHASDADSSSSNNGLFFVSVLSSVVECVRISSHLFSRF